MEGKVGFVLIQDRPVENCIIEVSREIAEALDCGRGRTGHDAVDGCRFKDDAEFQNVGGLFPIRQENMVPAIGHMLH